MLKNALREIRRLLRFLIAVIVDMNLPERPAVIPATLLLVRLDSIGDYVLFRNYIETIKTSGAFKGYKITLCGNVVWRTLAEALDRRFIDDFLWVDRKRFMRDPLYRRRVLLSIKKRGFEAALQPVFSRELAFGDAVIRASGADQRIGSVGDLTNMKKWEKRIGDGYYTRLVKATEANLFEFSRNREFFEELLGIRLDIARPHIDAENLAPDAPTPPRSYAVLFPGGRERFRRWAEEGFAEIADFLARRFGLHVLIAGSSSDKRLAKKITARCRHSNPLDLTGKTPLPRLVKLLSESTLLVSNDTGSIHLACAVNAKAVCISNGNHFGRFNPYPPAVCGGIRYVYPRAIMDRIGDFEYLSKRYRYGSALDINKIRPEDVKKAIEEVLGDGLSSISGKKTRCLKEEGGLKVKGMFEKSSEAGRPLITVITVVRNDDRKIEETISSVITQNYDNIEYIIIDGRSDDGTLDIIKRYEEKLAYWVSEEDEGIYDAMNKGVALAKGSIVYFLNSGDSLHAGDVLKKVAALFDADESIGIVYGLTERFSESHGIRYSDGKEVDLSKVWRWMPTSHQSIFYRRGLFDIVGRYDTSFRIYADLDWLLRFVEKSGEHRKRGMFLNMVVSRTDLHGFSTEDLFINLKDREKVVYSRLGKSVLRALYFRLIWLKYLAMLLAMKAGVMRYYRKVKYGIFKQ
jgi:ADP-heptose:LPS heptosyltransferase/glycosyltransferase involved in cell wall biosynthesis